MTRAVQQMAAISENRSLTADNSTRQMMAGLGVALTRLGVSTNELKQNLPRLNHACSNSKFFLQSLSLLIHCRH